MDITEKLNSVRDQVLVDIKEKALITGESFKLASGQTSSHYVNCKELTLEAACLERVAKLFCGHLLRFDPKPNTVAGVSIGGDPIVAAVILEAYRSHQLNWKALLIRKKAKEHGLTKGRHVEGVLPEESQEMYLLEDVISTGKSSREAAQFLSNEGYKLKGVIALIDREMGGVEALRSELGCPVETVFKLSEFAS